MKKLSPGDHVALSVNFLRNTNQIAGGAGAMRGTLLSIDGAFARVKWSDWSPSKRARLAAQWGEDFAEDAERNGEMVNLANLCRVGANSKFCAC